MTESISIRLPDEIISELDRVAARNKKTRGVVAKELLLESISELDRLATVDLRIQQLDSRIGALAEEIRFQASANPANQHALLAQSVNQLRASLATVVFRLLVDKGDDEAEAAEWVSRVFNVQDGDDPSDDLDQPEGSE